jgi:tripeptidyl-peptidase-1
MVADLVVSQVRAYMAPLNKSVSAVKDWLSTYGIAPTTLPGHGDWLGFSTTIEKASALFGAQFATFKHTNTGREQVWTMVYSVPADLKLHIELVYPMIS